MPFFVQAMIAFLAAVDLQFGQCRADDPAFRRPPVCRFELVEQPLNAN
jgi:hypothetical protein